MSNQRVVDTAYKVLKMALGSGQLFYMSLEKDGKPVKCNQDPELLAAWCYRLAKEMDRLAGECRDE